MVNNNVYLKTYQLEKKNTDRDKHGSTPSKGTHPKKKTGPKRQDDGNDMAVDKKYALYLRIHGINHYC